MTAIGGDFRIGVVSPIRQRTEDALQRRDRTGNCECQRQDFKPDAIHDENNTERYPNRRAVKATNDRCRTDRREKPPRAGERTVGTIFLRKKVRDAPCAHGAYDECDGVPRCCVKHG